jgi:hypothetical protein
MARTTLLDMSDLREYVYTESMSWEEALEKFTQHYQPKQDLVNRYLYKVRKSEVSDLDKKTYLAMVRQQVLSQHVPLPIPEREGEGMDIWKFFETENMKQVVLELDLKLANNATLTQLTKLQAISFNSYLSDWTPTFLKARASRLAEYDKAKVNDFLIYIQAGNTQFSIWNRHALYFLERLEKKKLPWLNPTKPAGYTQPIDTSGFTSSEKKEILKQILTKYQPDAAENFTIWIELGTGEFGIPNTGVKDFCKLHRIAI